MSDKTVRDHINDIRNEVMHDITPDRASRLLNQLSVLLGSINEELVSAEMEYNRFYEMMTGKYEKVTEARAHAKASEAYERKLRAEALEDVTRELIRAMKYGIKVKISEMKEVQYEGYK